MRRALTLLAVGACTIGVLGHAASASPKSDRRQAFAAVRVVINDLAAGEAADAWGHLHPAQQAVVSKAAYVACRSGKGTLDLAKLKLENASAQEIAIPGTTKTARGLALVVRATLGNGQTDSFPVNEIKVGRTWRYILNENELSTCRDG